MDWITQACNAGSLMGRSRWNHMFAGLDQSQALIVGLSPSVWPNIPPSPRIKDRILCEGGGGLLHCLMYASELS